MRPLNSRCEHIELTFWQLNESRHDMCRKKESFMNSGERAHVSPLPNPNWIPGEWKRKKWGPHPACKWLHVSSVIIRLRRNEVIKWSCADCDNGTFFRTPHSSWLLHINLSSVHNAGEHKAKISTWTGQMNYRHCGPLNDNIIFIFSFLPDNGDPSHTACMHTRCTCRKFIRMKRNLWPTNNKLR